MLEVGSLVPGGSHLWMKEQLGLQGEVEAKVQALDKFRLKNRDCSNV